MAILSDNSIIERLKYGDLNITPIVDMEAQLQPCSFDIRLGPEYKNMDTGEVKNATETEDETLVFEPNTFYLAHTLETIDMPDDLGAQVTGRSSIGREGVMIHVTAGWVDAGFGGDVTLEVYVLADESVELEHGQRIGQLVFYEMDEAAQNPYGEKADAKYHNQRGVTEGKLADDKFL